MVEMSEARMLVAVLEALLAAVHADDPKREILVRVGDALRMASAASQWRTMRTAPKDGSPIMYHNGKTVDAIIGYCQWVVWPEEDNLEAWWDYERDDEACPKFWMPVIQLPHS